MVELLQALAPHFRAIAIDYPSHGHSDHIDWQPAIEDYARCVVEVMDALRIERAFAMGEAVGAAMSIALGARWPQRIDKAVLINIALFQRRRHGQERHRRHRQGAAERRHRASPRHAR